MSQESKQDTPFEKRTREVLDESASRLDGHTLSRLTQARHAALEQLQGRPRQSWRIFVPAGVAAAAALMVVMWVGPGDRPRGGEGGPNPIEDFELLTDADAPDFVEDGEDLEFYEWAAGELET
jgi:uncharacterized protein DUF3619